MYKIKDHPIMINKKIPKKSQMRNLCNTCIMNLFRSKTCI